MATEVVVRVKLEGDQQIKQFENQVESLGGSLKKVDDNSKEADSSLKKVGENGGAISTLDSLTGGLATRIRDAAEASKLFNTNLKATRGALLASGVGALVVILGTVIAYWEEITQLTKTENFLLGKQIEQLERVTTELDQQVAIIDSRIELAELEGKSTEQLQKQKLALLQQEQAINQTLIQKLELQLENEKALAREFTIWERIKVEALRIVDPVKAAGLEAVSQLETNEKTLELQQRINDAKQRQVGLEIQVFKAQNPEAGGGQTRDIGAAIGVSQADRVQPRIDAELAADTAIANSRNQLAFDIQETNRLIAQSDKEQSDQRIQLEQAVEQAKKDSLLNGLALASQIAGEQTKVGKAFAVAQATISGIEGVQNAFTTAAKSPITTLFPAYPTIQAGLAAAFSALQIKKILSTDPTGKTAPNLGGSVGGGQAAPSFNVVGTSGVNQLAETLNQDQQPLRAFVVGNDVTTQQSADRNIVETATIG